MRGSARPGLAWLLPPSLPPPRQHWVQVPLVHPGRKECQLSRDRCLGSHGAELREVRVSQGGSEPRGRPHKSRVRPTRLECASHTPPLLGWDAGPVAEPTGSVSERLCPEPGHHRGRPQNDLSAKCGPRCPVQAPEPLPSWPSSQAPALLCSPVPRQLGELPQGACGWSCIGRRGPGEGCAGRAGPPRCPQGWSHWARGEPRSRSWGKGSGPLWTP